MTLPLRPAVILRQEPGPHRSVDLTVLCANSMECQTTVEWSATTAEGLADAVERAVLSLEDALADQAGAVASLLADALEPLSSAEDL